MKRLTSNRAYVDLVLPAIVAILFTLNADEAPWVLMSAAGMFLLSLAAWLKLRYEDDRKWNLEFAMLNGALVLTGLGFLAWLVF